MKLINPSFEIYEQGPGLEGIYEAIERAGRTCYKSTRPEGQTAKDFVDRMIASKHYAMLEHGTVYLKWTNSADELGRANYAWPLKGYYDRTPYSKITESVEYLEPDEFQAEFVSEIPITTTYITTNMRVLVENGWLDDLKYLCEPTEYHEKRVTVRFTTSNSIMREFTRHRSHSFAVESTRYCNYSKDKFNNELTFIAPVWMEEEEITLTDFLERSMFEEYDVYSKSARFTHTLQQCEKCYLDLLKNGMKPQEAREILPLATKCDMVMTGFISDWNHFFDLRARGTTGAPHPDAKALAGPLMNELISRGFNV